MNKNELLKQICDNNIGRIDSIVFTLRRLKRLKDFSASFDGKPFGSDAYHSAISSIENNLHNMAKEIAQYKSTEDEIKW